MHILVVSQYFWPENFRINDWVNGMIERGHRVTVLTGKPNYPKGDFYPEFLASPDGFSKYTGAEIVRTPMVSRGQRKWRLALNYISFALSAASVGLWKLRKYRFDVCFVFGVSPITIVIPALIHKSIKRTPVVLWVLDLWPESLRAVGIIKSHKLLSLISRGVAYLYNKCDIVLGQSLSFQHNIQALAPKHNYIAYTSNWSEQAPNSLDIAAEVSIFAKSNIFTILFTGNVGEAQDFPTILNAAEKLKGSNIEILIVGTGRKFEWVAEQVKARNLNQIVKLLGSYPLEKMPSFYAIADAFLVTLVEDEAIEKTIPGKLHAYMAYGKPILGAVNGEAARVLREAQCALVADANNANDLASNMQKLSLLPDKDRYKMGMNAQSYYSKEFERNKVMIEFENHLLNAIKLKS